MTSKRQAIFVAKLATVIFAAAVHFVPATLQGEDIRTPQPAGKFVVHEWGTFTSFSGSDGINLEFRPLTTNDLPPFIMTPFNQPGSPVSLFTKQSFVARQRMETPVTYFYSDVPRVVNVRVDFPDGMLTEWYPVVKFFEPPHVDGLDRSVKGRAFLDWGPVRISPPAQFAAIRMKGPDAQPIAASLPPVAESNHYGRARETDSAIVETVDQNGASHFEKFLFYRGIGNFKLPLKLIALGNDQFLVHNSGQSDTGVLFLVRIENGQVRFTRSEQASAGSTTSFQLPKAESTVDRLADAMVRELTAAGLYEKESLAMVNTWRTSWFGENGTRLLYIVPAELTESLLPLTVEPAPDERVRILVGRLETLTPEDCERLTDAFADKRLSGLPATEAFSAELAQLGRFAEPALQFLGSQAASGPRRERLEAILAEIRGK